MRHGNLIHEITRDANSSDVPKVGDGATTLQWSDRKAHTIIEVTETRIVLQQDTATRTDSYGMSDVQNYSYSADPNGPKSVFELKTSRKKATKGQKIWTAEGSRPGEGEKLVIGVRDAHHDFSH